jgi:hypothetical protein
MSAATGDGPRSFGNDKILNYVGKTSNFTVGQTVTGATSGAFGMIIADSNGTTGELRLTSVSGSFQDSEAITDPLGGAARARGASRPALDDEQDNTVRWKYIGPGAGIKVRAEGVTIRDVFIDSMSGNGIHIQSADPEVQNITIIADGWMLRNVAIFTCDGHGLFVRGGDTQGGAYIGGVVLGNGGPASDEDFTGPGFNIYESSFLGNTYISIQLGGGGQGSIFSNSIGGGNTFIGCYQEGSGGGQNVVDESCVVIGGGLSVSKFKTSVNTESPVVTIAPTQKGNGVGQLVWGYNGPNWRPEVWVPLGHRRSNNGNLFEVIRAGKTGTRASGGPSGTGADIVDGEAHWKFVHEVTPDGLVEFGSANPDVKSLFNVQAPEDVDDSGLPTYYLYGDFRYGDFGLAKDVHAFTYGLSGVGGESGTGIMHAVNRSILTEWPMHVPAGRAMAEFMWIGGCRIAFGIAEPKTGTWNKGDRIFFKGCAVSAGGAEGLICTEEGTAGSYPGVGQIARTATTHGDTMVDISGPAMVAVRERQDFKVGDGLTINGVTSRVRAVSDNGLQLTMSDPIPAASAQSIAFKNPVFKKFGSISA